jgi:hypothetical protein
MSQHPPAFPKRKREKPFQTSKRPGKGSKAEATAALKAKYGSFKGGVWEEDEERELMEELRAGNNDIYKLGEKFNRTHRVVRRKLKRIAVAMAEESQDVDRASAFTGLEVDGLKKMLANKTRREKKKAEKAKNKTLPPRDQVVDLLTGIDQKLDFICRRLYASSLEGHPTAGPAQAPDGSTPAQPDDQLPDSRASHPTTDRSAEAPVCESGCAGSGQPGA